MKPMRRLAIAFLVLLLPVQSYAAACAQLCLQAQQEQLASAMPESPDASDHHCADGDLGSEKCCNAHSFLMDHSFPLLDVVPFAHEPAALVQRWTSFIPEEPSPPPISSVRSA